MPQRLSHPKRKSVDTSLAPKHGDGIDATLLLEPVERSDFTYDGAAFRSHRDDAVDSDSCDRSVVRARVWAADLEGAVELAACDVFGGADLRLVLVPPG
jgi:hypothetical protein